MMQSVYTPFRLNQKRELLIPAAYVTGAFFLGLIAGASVIHTLSPSQLDELRQYLNSFLNGMGALAQNGQFPALKAWGEILAGQLSSLVILWLLGLCVVGAPLVVLMVGMRGFILGFTVGFLVEEKAGQGMLLALAAVLPQNLFYVPGLLGAGTLALFFALSLYKSSWKTPVFRGIILYTLFFIAFTLLVLIGTWIEAYLVPGIMRLTIFL